MRFAKYENNPILGNTELGTCFDVYVTKESERYRMDFSWRPKKSLAVTFSDDGIHWEMPQTTLAFDNKFKMWYTGHARGYCFIGYAESDDGINFKRVLTEPVLISDHYWEKTAVMNPCVLYEDGKYKMWYAGGETYEPNALGYAESDDGIHWTKSKFNPIFVKDEKNYYEQDRIGGCQIIRTEDMGYVMFYIGYENIDKAQVCIARSDNGITGWEKSPLNPIISPTPGSWDSDACYKPSFLWNEDKNCWMIWYNGRKQTDEFIGLVFKEGRELFR